jgi:Domain of unknown function (DUF4382)
MTSRFLFSAVALATLSSLAACGGGAASDDDMQAQQVGGIGGSGVSSQSIGGIGGSGVSSQSIGGIGGSGVSSQSIGGIGGSGVTSQGIGGIGGSGISTQAIGGIGGSGISAQSIGGIGGSGVTAQAVGGIGGSGVMSVASTRACGVRSVNVTIAGVRVNQDRSAAADGAGWVEVAAAVPVRMDLMTLASGSKLPVDMTTLATGTWRQVRLQLVDGASVVTTAGVETPLAVPGAAQGGLPLDAAITVADGQVAASTQDLDVCNAVTTSAGSYALGAVARGATQVASAF